MSAKQRAAKWKWARSSKQAKKVREIGKIYYQAVQVIKSLSTAEKEKKKKAKRAKAMKHLEEIKSWRGPVSETSLESLDSLNEKQLLSEVRYLRATVAPNIREKRKEGNKFVKFSKEQLIFQIRNSIKPMSDGVHDVEGLLSSVFGLQEEIEQSSTDEAADSQPSLDLVEAADSQPSLDLVESEVSQPPLGLVGQFSGPLDELSVGVVIAVGNENFLQLYEGKRYGFIPDGKEAQPLSEWTLVEEIEKYQYVNYPSKPDTIFLKF